MTCRLFSDLVCASSDAMWKYLVIGCATAGALLAQGGPSQLDYANLREDVRVLTQRVGDLSVRLEQLERENGELRQRVGASDRNYVTMAQLQQAVEDANRAMRVAVKESSNETLQHVAAQMEKLARQTNTALDSISKNRPAVQTSFSEDYAKEGVSYTVQKGETLALIAKKTGARVQDIVNANKIADPSRIVVGQTLFIPNPPTSASK